MPDGHEETEPRALACFRAYVSGEDEVNQMVSCVRGIPEDELRTTLEQHKSELEAIDPAREAILESFYTSVRDQGVPTQRGA